MKKLFLIFLMAIPLASFGAMTQIDASGGAPIPTAFSASNPQSQVRECVGNVIEVLNQTTGVLSMGLGKSTLTPVFDYVAIPPGPASGNVIRPKGGTSLGTYVYIRSTGTAITSGSVQVSCYTEERD